MNGLSLKELCDRCHITCSKCLDTGKLWKSRDHPLSHLDLKGSYDVIRCNSCSDGGWLHCSHTNVINEAGILLFHRDDNNEGSRISIVNKIYSKLLDDEKRVKEQLEHERLIKIQREHEDREREENEIRMKLQRHREEQEQLEQECLKRLQRELEEKEQLEQDRLKKLQRDREEKERLEKERIHQEELQEQLKKRKKESIEQQMNDGSDQPLYGESIDDTFSTTTEHIHIQGELGKLIDKVSNAIQAVNGDLLSLANAVKDIKIDLDMKSEDEKIEKTKCCQSTTKDGFPIYLFLKVKIHNESSSCKLLEWCGCFNIVSKITVKYMVLFPKNKVAKKECDDGVSAITGVKLDGIITFLKQ